MPPLSPRHAAFGDAVRHLRRRHEWSQEQLGYECGLHRNYIGGVERGELNATLTNVWKLASGLGVLPSQLLALSEKLLDASGGS